MAARRFPEQTKHYSTQAAAERAAERAHRTYYSVTLWRVHDRDWAVHMKELKPVDLRGKNPEVYDNHGKLVGKFSRKTAQIVARVVGGTIGKRRNPGGKRITYGVVVHGGLGAGLSQANFDTVAAARRYIRMLYSRGLLFGRSTEILKHDNEKMTSARVSYKAYNPGNSKLFPTKEAAVAYARTHRKKGQRVFLQRVKGR